MGMWTHVSARLKGDLANPDTVVFQENLRLISSRTGGMNEERKSAHHKPSNDETAKETQILLHGTSFLNERSEWPGHYTRIRRTLSSVRENSGTQTVQDYED